MARIRTVKPEFWTDDALVECSIPARLVAIGVLNFADDCGNLDRSAKQIKMRVLPADNIDVEPLVQELITVRYLEEYEVDGQKYLHIRSFTKHQVINKPSTSKIPALPEHSRSATGALPEDSRSGDGGLPDGMEGNGKEGSKPKPPARKRAEYPAEVHEIYDEYAKWIRDYPASRQRALKSIAQRVKEHGVDIVFETIRPYYDDCVANNRDPQYRFAASNFFGRDAHYRNFLPKSEAAL